MAEIIAGTYEIVEKIGSGGGGIVYLANHIRLGKKVILKADRRKLTTRPEKLRREVDVLKELKDPHIPQVYDFFAYEDTVYTAMEYIEGESFDKLLKRNEKFSQAQVIRWAKQLLKALCYLHSPIHGDPPRGYLHSDIKPANIMLMPRGDVCLIDFNISLALGEETVIGYSPGYASPEHYGLDYSSESQFRTETGSAEASSSEEKDPTTRSAILQPQRTDSKGRIIPSSLEQSTSGLQKKIIVPDVRSDIYSLGATLYHLLSGVRPAKEAQMVVPLPETEFSPQIVTIIARAMNPNPDLRYQTAAEMLEAVEHLHQKDSRYVRWRRRTIAVYASLSVLFTAGIVQSFIGLKRMQTAERWLRITEDAAGKLREGDRVKALQDVMQVYEEQQTFLAPSVLPQTQKVLTDSLGVYDLSDDFRIFQTVELPSAPLDLKISSDAETALCMCAEKLVVLDLDDASIIAELSAEGSSLAEAEYIDSNTVVFAGADGVTAYDLKEKRILWQGERATGIAVSDDGKTVAAVYREDQSAFLYDAVSGEKKREISFNGKQQDVAVNDQFINPLNNLFCLNRDGSQLAVSFSDSTLKVYDLNNESGRTALNILDGTEKYDHFEGGFYQHYFAFAVSNRLTEKSSIAVIDTDAGEYAGGFGGEGYYFTSADENGIFVGIDNMLVQIDPVSGEQRPLVDTAERIDQYNYDGNFAMISSAGCVYLFDEGLNEIGSFERKVCCDRVAVRKDKALIGSSDSPVLWITKYETHPNATLASYDPTYSHDEARISGDRQTIMLFSYDRFRICDLAGEVIEEVEIPNAFEVYDQQFRRDGEKSWLEVIYNDGTVDYYDASTGVLTNTDHIQPPDLSLDEEFETHAFRIESSLHEAPKVYDKQTGTLVKELSDDGYLTYISELENGCMIAQYVTTDDRFYGYLMDQDCEVLAYLPNLCDVLPDELLFDLPSGDIRSAKVYELDELTEMACQELEKEKNKHEN